MPSSPVTEDMFALSLLFDCFRGSYVCSLCNFCEDWKLKIGVHVVNICGSTGTCICIYLAVIVAVPISFMDCS